MSSSTKSFTVGSEVSFRATMRFQTGTITSIKNGVANVRVSDGFDGSMFFKVPVTDLINAGQW